MEELKLIKKEEQKLFHRTKYIFEYVFDGPTPSRENLKKKIAEQFNLNNELIVLNKIKQKFGESLLTITCTYYEKEDLFRRIVSKYLIKREIKQSSE